MHDFWQRFRWAWHKPHGGIMPKLNDHDASIEWVCLCGATLGTTDLTQDGCGD